MVVALGLLALCCAAEPSLPRHGAPIPAGAAYGTCGDGSRIPVVAGTPYLPYLQACGGTLDVYDAEGARLRHYAQLD